MAPFRASLKSLALIVMGKRRKILSRYWAFLTLSVLIVISVSSLMPLPELPLPGNDKTHHLISYAALMAPSFMVEYRSRFLLLVIFCLWGGGIELVQPYVNRHGEWLDFFANVSGLAVGAMLGWLFVKLYPEASG